MRLFEMIWNGTAGLGAGTVILKALFILVLGVLFWLACELIKHLVKILSTLAVEAIRYLAVVARGWPKDADAEEERRRDVWGSDRGSPKGN